MITLTTEQAQQIEEALVKIADLRNLGKIQPEVIAFETLYVIRAARAQEQAEQPVSQEYQDHLVNQSFDWAAMAAKHQFMEGYRIGLAEMREKCAKVAERFEPDEKCSYVEYASAAIRAIKFEGDTGFRPVSEMVGCAYCNNPLFAGTKCNNCGRITLAEQAEPEPLMDYERINALREGEQNGAEDAYFFVRPENDTPSLRKMFCQGFERGFHKGLKYAAPVRTKDLTDDELQPFLDERWNLPCDTAHDR